MKYQMTLFIADKKINEFMSCVDMRHDRKQFYNSKLVTDFETSKVVDDKYILNIIEKSKNEEGYWIPAIEYQGTLYHDPELIELSDGRVSLFLGEKKPK